MARSGKHSSRRLLWLAALLGSGVLGVGSVALVRDVFVSSSSSASSRGAPASRTGPEESPVPDGQARRVRLGRELQAPKDTIAPLSDAAARGNDLLTDDIKAAVERARKDALVKIVERHQRRWRAVPWHERPACEKAANAAPGAKFVRAAPNPFEILAEPAVPAEAIAHVTRELPKARELARTSLGLDAEPPAIYVYADLESLRENSCANGAAVAYYDGKIHLSLIAKDARYIELTRSLQHEYVHHALIGHGIQEPAWLQEGVAMVLSGEPAGHWRPRGELLELSQMVAPIPPDASADQRQAHYGQAYAMTLFLQKLCANRKGCGYSNLVEALEYENAAPATLFEWVVDERASSLSKAPKALWESYAANDMQLLPADVVALAQLAASESKQ